MATDQAKHRKWADSQIAALVELGVDLPDAQRQRTQGVAQAGQQPEHQQQQGLDQCRHLDITRRPVGHSRRLDEGDGERQEVDAEQHAQHHPEIAPVG